MAAGRSTALRSLHVHPWDVASCGRAKAQCVSNPTRVSNPIGALATRSRRSPAAIMRPAAHREAMPA